MVLIHWQTSFQISALKYNWQLSKFIKLIPIHTYFWLALRMCQPGTLNLTPSDFPRAAALKGKPGSSAWAPAKINPEPPMAGQPQLELQVRGE